MTSIILNTDGYKPSHFEQYPEGTEYINSYIESRGVDYDTTNFPRVSSSLFFGLQMYLKKYLTKPITKADIEEAEAIFADYGVPFNKAGWEYILNTHGGHLPLEVFALPEGSIVPLSTPLVQVRNTDPKVAWLTSYIETSLLRAVWYPTTVATLSWHIRSILAEYLSRTADDMSALDFMLHDFGARGVSSEESAAIGGLAHLVSFKGSDTLSALLAARDFYYGSKVAFSIPAAEHSTITSWGKDNEGKAYENMVDKFGDKLYAVVSDSYDIYNAVENIWGGELKEKVIRRGGRLVVRPDSGDPTIVVSKIVSILGEKFGFTVNSKGFRVLHPSVRVIQGDGVNHQSIDSILFELMKNGWSAENVVFGMGGALLQKVNRDTLKFAMKASAIFKDNRWQDVYKDPKTDSGKRSKRGVLGVINNFETVRVDDTKYNAEQDQLRLVFDGGDLLIDEKFEVIRERAK